MNHSGILSRRGEGNWSVLRLAEARRARAPRPAGPRWFYRGCVLGALAAVAFLAGCAVQRYHPAPLSPGSSATALESRTLADPALRRYIERNLGHAVSPWPPKAWDLRLLTLAAFYFQPALDAARARLAQAGAAVITAGARPNPTLSLTPGIPSPFLFSVDLSFPLETAGKRRYRIAAASASTDAARYDLAGVAWAVRSAVRAALVENFLASRQLGILQSQAASREEQVRLLDERLAAGEIGRGELDAGRAALAENHVVICAAEGRLAAARATLAGSVGVPAGSLDGLNLSWPGFDRPPAAASLSPQSIERDGVVNRLDVRRALAQYAAAQAALQLEIARQYPDISIGPGYAYEERNNFFTIPVSVALPIFHRNQGPIAEAAARREEAAAAFRAAQAKVIAETSLALASYRSALGELAATDDELQRVQQGRVSLAEQSTAAGEQDRLALAGVRLESAITAQARLDALGRAQTALGALEDAVQRPLDPGDLAPIGPQTPALASGSTAASRKETKR